MATAWHETAFPVPVHAAIMGDNMDQTRAATTVMEKKRRIVSNEIYLYFYPNGNEIQATEH
jgi:hypothetical protein